MRIDLSVLATPARPPARRSSAIECDDSFGVDSTRRCSEHANVVSSPACYLDHYFSTLTFHKVYSVAMRLRLVGSLMIISISDERL